MDHSSTDLFLHGRVAVVTGGSRGIGRGIAELLIERGAAVGIAYREREEDARAFEAAMRSAGGRAWAGKCDVADEKSVTAFFEQVVSELGPVDILVNNAGVSRDAHIALLGLPQWQQVMHVNLDGVYHCVRAVVRGMLLRRWGRIINVSSPSARMPLPGQSAYAASKAGLEGLTRALSRDLAGKGVLVNAVVAWTDRNRHARHHAGCRARGASCAPWRSAASARRVKWPRSWRFWRPGHRAM